MKIISARRIAIGASLLVIVLLGGCSGRKSEQYRKEGDTLFHLGKIDEAAGAYRRAEEVNPNNAMAKVGQGRCLLVKQQFDEALAAFQSALKIDPALDTAHMDSVRVLLKQGKGDEALATASRYEKVAPLRGGVLAANVLTGMGRVAEAIEKLTSLRTEFPEDLNLHLNLAAAYLAASKPADAQKELEAVLAGKDPDAAMAARLLLTDVYEGQGKIADMVTELERLSQEQPKDMGIKLALTYALLKGGRAKDAEAQARGIYQDQPNSGWANHLLGSCLLAQKQYAEAVPYLEKAAEALPLFSQAERNLTLAKAGGQAQTAPQPPTARPMPASEAGAVPENAADWRTLWRQANLGPLLERRAEFIAQGGGEAIETLALAAFIRNDGKVLQELRGQLPAESPLNGFFQAIETRNSDQFMQVMKQWSETDPVRSVLRANAYAAGLAVIGARFQALHALVMCFDSAKDSGITLYNLAQILRSSGSPLVAARVLGRLVPIAVNNADAQMLRYSMFREGGALDDAQKAAEIAYSLFPASPSVSLNLAQAYLDTGRMDVAEKVLRRAVADHPDAMAVQVALGRFLLHAEKPEEAGALLDGLQAPPEYATEIQATKAFCLARMNDWDGVLALTQPKEGEQPRGALALLRAAALVSKDQIQEAAAFLKQQPFAAGAKLTTYVQLALAALGEPVQMDSSETNASAKTLAGNRPAAGQYLFALACIEIPSFRLALTILQDAYDKTGGDPVLAQLMLHCMTRAISEDARGEKAGALAAKHPDSGRVWLGLAEVRGSLKQTQAEGEALEKATALSPDLAEGWLKRAFFLEHQDDWPGALDAYRRYAALAPSDPIGNNNMAYAILVTNGDASEALQLAQAAAEKMPNTPEILHTLGLAYSRAGDLEQGRKNLLLALALRPAEPTLLLDYGQVMIAIGKKEEGRGYIQLAVRFSEQIDLAFPRRDEADRVLAAP